MMSARQMSKQKLSKKFSFRCHLFNPFQRQTTEAIMKQGHRRKPLRKLNIKAITTS